MITTTITTIITISLLIVGLVAVNPTSDARAQNPYCDQVGPNFKGDCHDRLDTDEETDVATCNDGSHEQNWQDCEDASGHNEDCADEGYNDGQNGSFNPGDCGDQYHEEFVKGCMDVPGNTREVCNSATDG